MKPDALYLLREQGWAGCNCLKCELEKMPKAKVHSGAAKRFKKTAAGFKRKHANKSHILTKMSTKRKRHLRGTETVNPSDAPLVKRMLREV